MHSPPSDICALRVPLTLFYTGGGQMCPPLFERVCRPPQGADIRLTLGDFFSFRVYFFLEKKILAPATKRTPRARVKILFFSKKIENLAKFQLRTPKTPIFRSKSVYIIAYLLQLLESGTTYQKMSKIGQEMTEF